MSFERLGTSPLEPGGAGFRFVYQARCGSLVRRRVTPIPAEHARSLASQQNSSARFVFL